MDHNIDRKCPLFESLSESKRENRLSLVCLGLKDYCDCEKCAYKQPENITEAAPKRLKLSLPWIFQPFSFREWSSESWLIFG